MDEQLQPDPSPERDDLEEAIQEALRADDAPGIPQAIDFGVPSFFRSVAAPQELADPQGDPPAAPDSDEDVRFAESAEPERLPLPHERAHSFDASSAEVNEQHFDFPPASESTVEPMEWPGDAGETAGLSEVRGPQQQQQQPAPPQAEFPDSELSPDEEIPFPESVPAVSLASPLVTPAGESYRSPGESRPINVEMQLPDQRELMDQIREQVSPLFDQLKDQLQIATSDAMDVERELMDRRNVY